MSKSPQAFRTISEVSEVLDIPAHVLRFWESRFPQLKPMKSNGGRRYYRPEDVDLLRGIRELLYEDGMTIKGVQKIFREQGVKSVMVRGQDTVDAEDEEDEDSPALLGDDFTSAQDSEDGLDDEGSIWDDSDIEPLDSGYAAPPPPLPPARVPDYMAEDERTGDDDFPDTSAPEPEPDDAPGPGSAPEPAPAARPAPAAHGRPTEPLQAAALLRPEPVTQMRPEPARPEAAGHGHAQPPAPASPPPAARRAPETGSHAPAQDRPEAGGRAARDAAVRRAITHLETIRDRILRALDEE
ncbi:MerR family transcriptional regulator [Paroceanicella profunda]|uniref:MerR family transcriptional regulator n=1 Tax=Paroceanicella profunda TaxID=2579971 RepID=UPI0019819439|nr:MerR family transcriptional regulator [Paroceanicella profunda]